VSCTSLFDFSHLGHLDPDCVSNRSSPNNVIDGDIRARKGSKQSFFLAENTRLKMPLWSVEKWSKLGFARLSIPRHFGRKARERLATDPGSADLRSKNERYFRSGVRLVNLIQECANILPAKAPTANKSRRRVHTSAMKELQREAKYLRQTLLVTFTGERLRRTFDWTLGSIGDDVSMYTCRLTEIELELFVKGACAAAAHHEWKNFGSRRIPVSTALLTTKQFTTSPNSRATKVTPDKSTNNKDARKRQKEM